MNPFLESIRAGDLEVVKYQVSMGADVRACDDYAVGCASQNGHLEVVKYLVALGANVRADDNYAVRYASQNGHLEVVKYLVSLGADISKMSYSHKCLIFGDKIYKFYLNQKRRKRLNNMLKTLIPMYYAPEMKGGFFAKKSISDTLKSINSSTCCEI